MIDKVKVKDTFSKLELGTGDILVYTEEFSPEELKEFELPTPVEYYDYILNDVTVHFRNRNAPKDTAGYFSLQLSKKMPYTTVADAVAKKLEIDPNYLRFVTHNLYTDAPKMEIKRELDRTLEDILRSQNVQNIQREAGLDVLYYEKLEMPLSECEKMKLINISWVSPSLVEDGPHKILADRNGTVEDLIHQLKEKIKQLKEAAKEGSKDSPKSDAAAEHEDKIKEEKKEAQPEKPAGTAAVVKEEVKEEVKAEVKEKGQEEVKEEIKEVKEEKSQGEEKEESQKAETADHEVEEKTKTEEKKDHAGAEGSGSGSGQYRLVEVFNNRISKVYFKEEPIKSLNDYAHFYIEEIPLDHVKISEGDQLVNVFHFHKDSYNSFGLPFLFLVKARENFKETLPRLQKKLGVPDKEFEKYKCVLFVSQKVIPIAPEEFVLGEHKFGQYDHLGLDHMNKARQSKGFYAERAIVFKN